VCSEKKVPPIDNVAARLPLCTDAVAFTEEVKLVRKGNWLGKKAEAHHPAAGSPAPRAELSRHCSTVSVTHRFL
jgi:hypothetical protein